MRLLLDYIGISIMKMNFRKKVFLSTVVREGFTFCVSTLFYKYIYRRTILLQSADS